MDRGGGVSGSRLAAVKRVPRGTSAGPSWQKVSGYALGSASGPSSKKSHGGYFVSPCRSDRGHLRICVGGCRPGCGHYGYDTRYGCGSYYRYNRGYDRWRYRCYPRFGIGFGFYSAAYRTYPVYSTLYEPYPVYTTVYQPYAVYTSPTYVVSDSGEQQAVIVGGEVDESAVVVDEAPATDAAVVSQPPIWQGEAGTVAPLPSSVGEESASVMPAEQMHRLMVQGVELFTQGEYEESAQLFLQVAMAAPDNFDATLAYAVGRFATGDFSMSAIAIRRGVRRFPDVVNAQFDIRDRYGRLADFDRHLAALEAFVSKQPDDADGLLVLGFVQHFTGRRESAADTFKRLKARSEADADLADIFLNARPLEELPPPPEEDAAGEDDDGFGPPATRGADAGRPYNAGEHRAGTYDAIENVAYTSGDQWSVSAGAYYSN